MLTKSDLLSFIQCPRKIWLEHHKPELQPKPGTTLGRREIDGLIVGEKARSQLGTDFLWPPSREENKAVAAEGAVKLLLASPNKAAAEVPLVAADLYARADALIPMDGGYILRETKASTFPLKRDKVTPDSPDEHHLNDVAIQAWVLEGSGLPTSAIELNFLDSKWRYPGNEDYSGLFKQLDVTNESHARKPQVSAWLNKAIDILKGSMPSVIPGKQCSDPYDCPFQEHCESLQPAGPEHPIELLPGSAGKGLARKLREAKGYTSLLEPKPDEFTGKQVTLYCRIQEAHRRGEAILESGAGVLMRSFPYPRYYFDFEGIDFPVPQWVGVRPYEHVPFQWSCHIELSPGVFEHVEFLDLTGNDPSLPCIEKMRDAIDPNDSGPIFVYQATYERLRLEELAIRHPAQTELVQKYVARLVDLLPIVRDNFYDPRMRGSFSIKKVLPVVAPDLSYVELDEVQDGTGAQVAYLVATKDPSTTPSRKEEIEKRLRTYCRQDTWAMVEIAHFLSGSGRPHRPNGM